MQVTEPDSCVRDPYLPIRISDTGEGMEDTVKESMVESFFTTEYGKDRGGSDYGLRCGSRSSGFY